MIILEYYNINYQHDPIRNFNLHKYKNLLNDDYVLVNGLGNSFGKYLHNHLYEMPIIKKYHRQGKKIMYMAFEEGNNFYPNYFKDNQKLCKFEEIAHKIFTICPYTANYLNKRYNNNKRVHIPFFFSEDFITKDFSKDIEIIYTGGFTQRTKELNEFLPLYDVYNIMKNYNYCWLGGIIQNYSDKTYQGKINLYSRSKIAVVHNVLVANYSLDFETKNLEHFKYHSTHKLVPQMKSRTFEAAFNKCILLAFKDPYSTIENFFEEKKDFLYWSNKQELENLVKNILENYDDYKYLSENAYKKSIKNYTTEIFFKKYILNNR